MFLAIVLSVAINSSLSPCRCLCSMTLNKTSLCPGTNLPRPGDKSLTPSKPFTPQCRSVSTLFHSMPRHPRLRQLGTPCHAHPTLSMESLPRLEKMGKDCEPCVTLPQTHLGGANEFSSRSSGQPLTDFPREENEAVHYDSYKGWRASPSSPRG